MPGACRGFAGLGEESRWQSKKRSSTKVTKTHTYQQAAAADLNMGIPQTLKKGDDGASGTSTQNGTDMDDVDRSDWPDIEELDSLGFTKG